MDFGKSWCGIMSFGTSKVFGTVTEAFILALMLVSVFAVLYISMATLYKVGIVAIVFTMILCANKKKHANNNKPKPRVFRFSLSVHPPLCHDVV